MMNNNEEMHYWFTVTEFARLCEEYGLDQCLKDFWGVIDAIAADNTYFGDDNG
jgi:hypothetical protein